MKKIGGFFELELRDGEEYYPSATRLNSGTNAFEAILLINNFSKVYLPYYSCDVLIKPLHKLNVKYKFYHIDKNLNPIFDYLTIQNDEAFLAINYFGLKNRLINDLKLKIKNLIVDNAQSFYSHPLAGTHTFYSTRKFFGVPDGSYLFTDRDFNLLLESDLSYNRCEHLLRRIDESPENGYLFYRANEIQLSQVPIRKMSNLTQSILKNIDYTEVKQKRVDNFSILDEALKSDNQLQLTWDETIPPMVYPFLTKEKLLHKSLIQENVYVARYWPSIMNRVPHTSIEYILSENLIPLPIDQRYGTKDMKQLIEIIRKLFFR